MQSKTLPDMVVEKRDVNNKHWLHDPILPWDEWYEQQLQSFLTLMEGSKKSWRSEQVLKELDLYLPESLKKHSHRIPEIFNMFVVKPYSIIDWEDAVEFVKDDECIEFFTLLMKWTKKVKLQRKKDDWFIDWWGTWDYERYLDRLNRKWESLWTLEKAFDAKYTFKMYRPIIEMSERMGIDMTPCMPYMHPGHWAFPAGHWAKFFEAIQYIMDTFVCTEETKEILVVYAYVMSMARTGWWVHLPQDNYASAYLAWIKDFSYMWE